jgi:3-methyladenine DNA glycosylase AlkC
MNKRQLAKTTTDPKVLDELSRDKNCYVRWCVVGNPNISPETLDELSKDEHYYVRYWVARNLNTTPETLDYLSKDQDWPVRWGGCRKPQHFTRNSKTDVY